MTLRPRKRKRVHGSPEVSEAAAFQPESRLSLRSLVDEEDFAIIQEGLRGHAQQYLANVGNPFLDSRRLGVLIKLC